MNDEKITQNKQKIIKVEQQQDQLSQEKKVIEEHLFQLDKELQKGFRKLSELNHEGVQNGYTSVRWMQKNNEIKQRTFQRQLGQANEEIAYAYKKANQQLEIEREELYAERKSFSWD